MYLMLDMIIIACGGYVLNGYYQMKSKGIIKEGLLLPTIWFSRQTKKAIVKYFR